MVALHDGEHGLRDVGELDQPRGGALCLQGEETHGCGWHLLNVEYANELVLGETGRCVEKVQDLKGNSKNR